MVTLRTTASLVVAACLLATPALLAQSKLIVTVIDQKTGEPIIDLNDRSFKVVDDKTQLRVDEVEFRRDTIDIMLLIDTSLVGEMVRPLAGSFINELGEKEQMAIVSYHSSADLIRDFTGSKQLLHQALEQVQYGNNPRVLDALYAAIDGGFTSSAGRRVIVVLSAGVEGRSRVTEGEVLRLARRRGVSIFPVYMIGAERTMFQRLSDFSGGALFATRRLKLEPPALSQRVYSVLRGYYELLVSGVQTMGNRVEVTVEGLPKSKRKVHATSLPLE